MTETVVVSIRPFLAVGISLLAAFLIMLSDKAKPNVREAWTLLAAFGKFAIVASMMPLVWAGGVYEYTLFNIVEGIGFTLRTDACGMLFAGLSSFLWILTSFYSIGYMRGHHEKNQTGYFAAFAVCMSAAMGIAMAGNLVTLFIFFEILTVATYPLVAHKRDEEATFSGRKYLIYTLISGQLFLAGIVFIYVFTGTTDFRAGGIIGLANAAPLWALQVMFFMLVLGGMVKAGMMPFHGWLVSAMVAPTPVSALLHAVAVVKAGAFVVLRIVGYVYGPALLSQIHVASWLAWLAAFTIITSSLIAMKQDNLKRRLAFSTVGQLSYVVLGTCILAPLSFVGAMFHIVAHAVMKITLFFCAGAIYVTTGKQNISDMKGIGKQMPFTMTAFTIASLGIAGMPFIVGLISKFHIAAGALQMNEPIYVAVLIISAMLSLGYLMPVSFNAFFRNNENGDFQKYGEASKMMLIPLCTTAVLAVVLGIMPNFGLHLFDLATMAAQSIIQGVADIGGGW
ncbi:MAG: cation:proton antiporter [Clostridiales bacterium]|nr:MAG: cation:proton antiporter [Clostridiales bacterium]